MAKSRKEPLPPSPEAREKLLAAVKSVTEPMTAAALAKLVSPPDRVSEAVAVTWLNEAVSAGTLFPYSPKTAKGKPRYWDRNLADLARQAMQAILPQIEAPFTFKDLLKRLSGPVKFTESDLLPALNAAVESQQLYPIPPATTKGSPRFWKHDLLELGRRTILELVEQKGPQPESALLKAQKGFPAEQAHEVIKKALANRELRKHPTYGKIKKELLGIRPPVPAPYLKEIGTQLIKVVCILKAAEVPISSIRRDFMELLEASGVPVTGSPHTHSPNTHSSASSPESGCEFQEHTAVDLVALLKQLEPGAARGALVGAGELRRAAGLEKQKFDRAVLDLARRQHLILHRHDYPTSLSPSALEELVFDGVRTYYVGIALGTGS